MKLELRVFPFLLILVNVSPLFSDNKSYVFAYLSRTLESLMIRDLLVSGPQQHQTSDISDLHNKVKAQVNASRIFGSKKVDTELIKKGIAWIDPYFSDDKNFEFLKPLVSGDDRVKIVTSRASKSLTEIFQEKNIHQEQFLSLEKAQSNLLDPIIKKTNNYLNGLNFIRLNLSKIDKKDLFLRLFNLVKSQSVLYGFSGIDYPKKIVTQNDLQKFSFESENEDANFYIKIAESLLKIIEKTQKIIQRKTKTLDEAGIFSDELVNYFNLLENMINLFTADFKGQDPQGKKTIFNELVKKSLDAVTGARLTGDEKEFQKGLLGLDAGQKEQIKRSISAFASSSTVKFYVFAGAPIRELWATGNNLDIELKKMTMKLRASIELVDLDKIDKWFIDQIFAYASSHYSKEEELYYYRIFIFLDGEVAKLTKRYEAQPSIYAQAKERLKVFRAYREVINKLKEFRNKHLSKLYKATTMVSQNPYNDEFKKSLLNLNANNLNRSEELFVQLAASQYFLKNLITNLAAECLKEIESNPSLETLERKVNKDGAIKNEYLHEYMRQELEHIKSDALKYWEFENNASTFKHALDKLSAAPEPVKNEPVADDSLDDVLRKRLAAIRHQIEDEEEEPEWTDD